MSIDSILNYLHVQTWRLANKYGNSPQEPDFVGNIFNNKLCLFLIKLSLRNVAGYIGGVLVHQTPLVYFDFGNKYSGCESGDLLLIFNVNNASTVTHKAVLLQAKSGSTPNTGALSKGNEPKQLSLYKDLPGVSLIQYPKHITDFDLSINTPTDNGTLYLIINDQNTLLNSAAVGPWSGSHWVVCKSDTNQNHFMTLGEVIEQGVLGSFGRDYVPSVNAKDFSGFINGIIAHTRNKTFPRKNLRIRRDRHVQLNFGFDLMELAKRFFESSFMSSLLLSLLFLLLYFKEFFKIRKETVGFPSDKTGMGPKEKVQEKSGEQSEKSLVVLQFDVTVISE